MHIVISQPFWVFELKSSAFFDSAPPASSVFKALNDVLLFRSLLVFFLNSAPGITTTCAPTAARPPRPFYCLPSVCR